MQLIYLTSEIVDSFISKVEQQYSDYFNEPRKAELRISIESENHSLRSIERYIELLKSDPDGIARANLIISYALTHLVYFPYESPTEIDFRGIYIERIFMFRTELHRLKENLSDVQFKEHESLLNYYSDISSMINPQILSLKDLNVINDTDLGLSPTPNSFIEAILSDGIIIHIDVLQDGMGDIPNTYYLTTKELSKELFIESHIEPFERFKLPLSVPEIGALFRLLIDAMDKEGKPNLKHYAKAICHSFSSKNASILSENSLYNKLQLGAINTSSIKNLVNALTDEYNAWEENPKMG